MTVTKRYKLPLFHVKKANFSDEHLPINSFITCMHVVCSIGQGYLLYNLSSEWDKRHLYESVHLLDSLLELRRALGILIIRSN